MIDKKSVQTKREIWLYLKGEQDGGIITLFYHYDTSPTEVQSSRIREFSEATRKVAAYIQLGLSNQDSVTPATEEGAIDLCTARNFRTG